MAGVAENLNVHVLKKQQQRLKWHIGVNNFLIEQLSSDYSATTYIHVSSDFSTPLWELYFDR